MKKIGLLSLVLLIALCSLGVAYSSWSAPLAIGGNLATATYPTVTTVAAVTPVGTTTATLNGNLVSKGTATNVNAYFDYGLTNTYGSQTTLQTNVPAGAFSAAITGLTSGTVYHFRANAIGGNGTLLTGLIGNGEDRSFTTAVSGPAAQFNSASVGTITRGSVTALPVGGSFATQSLDITAIRTSNGNFGGIITVDIKNNSLTNTIRVIGVTSSNNSGSLITVTYDGVLLGATAIAPNQTASGTINLSASGNTMGTYKIVVTYALN